MTSIKQDQSFLNIKGQVAKVLLEYARNVNNGHNRLSQRDIATMLGTGWDTVHISLKALYNEGIIRIERNRIVVNKELIQKVAGAV